jgi:hypothetical protein
MTETILGPACFRESAQELGAPWRRGIEIGSRKERIGFKIENR